MCFKVRFLARLHFGFLFPVVAPSHPRTLATHPLHLLYVFLTSPGQTRKSVPPVSATPYNIVIPCQWGIGEMDIPHLFGEFFHTRSTLSPTLNMRAKICNQLIASLLKYFFRVWHAACIMLSEHSSQTVTQFTNQQSTIIKQLKNNDYEKDVFRSSSCICDGFSEQRFR